jgi:hypothetical protein
MNAFTPRTFRMAHRRTAWWGRRRWDCQVIETGKWLGWNHRSREYAVAHVRDLRLSEANTARLSAAFDRTTSPGS